MHCNGTINAIFRFARTVTLHPYNIEKIMVNFCGADLIILYPQENLSKRRMDFMDNFIF